MRAAWYEKQGPAREVLVVGEMPDPRPGPGEVRIRIAASGINPGDIKKRQDSFGVRHAISARHSAQRRCRASGSGRRGRIFRMGRPAGVVLRRTILSPVRHGRGVYRCAAGSCCSSCPRTCRRTKALALGYPASRLTAPSMSGATWRGGRCWCKGPEALLECVR